MGNTSTQPRRGPGRPSNAERAAATARAASAHPGRVQIEVALGADGEEKDCLVGGAEGFIKLQRGKPVWVKPWVVEHLRLAEIGVSEPHPTKPDEKITVMRRRFSFAVLQDPERLLPQIDYEGSYVESAAEVDGD